MGQCAQCEEPVDGFVYTCTYCERAFCVSHRLPEKHACTHLPRPSAGTWFAEKFDAGGGRMSVGSNRDRLVSDHPPVSTGSEDIASIHPVDRGESGGSRGILWWLAVLAVVVILVSVVAL